MADVLSRCCAVNEIPQSRVDGPQFLSSHKSDWTIEIPYSDKLLDLDPEIKKVAVECAEAIVHTVDEQPLDRLINHYSSYYRLKKAAARLLRIVNYFKRDKGDCNINDPVTGREMKIAEELLVKHVQSTCY